MICKFCQQDKDKLEFYLSYTKNGKMYYNTKCKICIKNLKRKRYKEDLQFQKKLKEQSLKYAHSEKGKIKRREFSRKRSKTEKFKIYRKNWFKNTEKGKASCRRRWNKWLKTDSGKFYAQRKHARRRSRIKIEADLTRQEWKDVLEKHEFKCVYCGCDGKLSQDHIIPLSKGGRHTKNNVVPACKSCNSKKGDKLWTQKL